MVFHGDKKNLVTKALAYKGRAYELSIGLTINYVIDKAFDFILYPLMIYKYGILEGGAIMAFLSFIACIGTMKFYDWSKRDWLGIETIKGLKRYEGENKIGRLTSWFLKRSEPVAFLFLSVWYDPFITTAYLRHGANKFNGMNKRDWTIFTGSLILGNAYWTLTCFMGITLVELAWKALAG